MAKKADKSQVKLDVKLTEVEEEKYWDAVEVKEIATKMIQSNAFQFPTNTPILYVFVDKSSRYWGKCQHCSGLVKFASAYEYFLIINHDVWQNLTDMQREALVYHELKHVGYDPLTDKYNIVDHDLEEFASVIQRYGMWRESVAKFTDVAMKKIQDTGEPK